MKTKINTLGKLVKHGEEMSVKDIRREASSQDGNVGRHGSPLCTTTSKVQLKYKTTITSKHQKLS